MIEFAAISTHAAAGWLPVAKVAGFFVASCFLEDVAAIGAGLLIATGDLSWPAAFTACFLGIWVGDTTIYAMARCVGRAGFERSSLRRFSHRVAQSEQWFLHSGTPILLFCRMVPAARLPTYLAAGFLRLPFARFLAVTGPASCIWVFIVLYLSRTFGERLVHWLDAYKHAGLILLAGVAAIFLIARAVRWLIRHFKARQMLERRSLTPR